MNGDPLNKTLFLMGDFPSPTQTFILREFRELYRRGHSLDVLAVNEVKRGGLDPAVEDMYQRARFLGEPLQWVPRGLIRSSLHPLRTASALKWALQLPHKSQKHRARFLSALTAAAHLAPWVQKSGYRYIHAHFAAYQTELAMCLSRLTDLPWGATWHAYGIWRDGNLLAEKIAGARTVLTCTRYNVEHLEKVAPDHANKVHLVYHGIDHTPLPEDVDYPEEDGEWIAIGRLVPKKGFQHIVEAAGILAQREVPFQIRILGDGPLRQELQGQIDQAGVQDRVTLAGRVDNSEVFEALANAKGLIAPSIRDKSGDIDGIPNVLLEAMAMARPVIGTRLSGIPEVVRSDETGELVETGDPVGLADAIQRIEEDPKRAERMGRTGRDLVRRLFDVRGNIDDQLTLIQAARRSGT